MELLTGSAAGALLFRVEEVDFALKAGFQVSLADITAEEFAALQIVQLERDRWQQEKASSISNEHL